MNICKECGAPAKRLFCSVACSNKYQGKRVAEANSGKYLVCNNCNELKSPGCFSYTVKGDVKSGKRAVCKKCSRNNKAKEIRDRDWKFNAIKVLLQNAKARAKRSNMEFTLTRDDVKIPDTCPVFGVTLFREGRTTWVNAPSIDRIDNTKGYTPDNIVVVSRRANILKKDATIDELIKLAEFYSKLKSDKETENYDQNQSSTC